MAVGIEIWSISPKKKKKVLFIMLEESVAQTSLALQNFRLVSACNNSNTVIGKLMERRGFQEWSFSAAKVT